MIVTNPKLPGSRTAAPSAAPLAIPLGSFAGMPVAPAALGAALLPVVRQALPGEAGRVALRLRPAGRLAGSPARRRLARALLQSAAEVGGGAVFDTTTGEMLLLGTMAGAGRRAAAALTVLSAEAPPPELFILPQDAAALLGWAATAWIAPPEVALPPPSQGLETLEARLAALPVDRVLLHRAVVRPGSAVPARGRRLRLSRPALAVALGPLAEDADLLAHAADRLAVRLLPALAAWARDMPGWRLLPLPRSGLAALPRSGLPPPSVVPGLFGVLPLAIAADPALAAYRQALAERGWALALDGLDAAALALVRPAGLAADLLLLRWSPALADRAPLALLREVPADRLLLTGCDGAEALALAARLGIAATGPAVEAGP